MALSILLGAQLAGGGHDGGATPFCSGFEAYKDSGEEKRLSFSIASSGAKIATD